MTSLICRETILPADVTVSIQPTSLGDRLTSVSTNNKTERNKLKKEGGVRITGTYINCHFHIWIACIIPLQPLNPLRCTRRLMNNFACFNEINIGLYSRVQAHPGYKGLAFVFIIVVWVNFLQLSPPCQKRDNTQFWQTVNNSSVHWHIDLNLI